MPDTQVEFVTTGDEYSTDNVAKKFRSAVGLASEDEMAAMLQISGETLATWRTKHKGPPFIKLGKKAFYCINSFSQWVAAEVDRQAAPRARARPRGFKPPLTPVVIDEGQAGVHVHY